MLVPPPLLYLLVLTAGYFLNRRWPLRLFPRQTPAVVLAGLALVLVGGGLALWAVLAFRRAGTSPNPLAPARALAADGPYRFTRNPMYLGLGVAALGVAVAFNALWPFLLVPAAMLLSVPLAIVREERYLEKRFGEPYRDYKGRVRRWL